MNAPLYEPAQTIYAALVAEQGRRPGRDSIEWIEAEREAVRRGARVASARFGLRNPSLGEIEAAERSAMGHVDYTVKFALGVAEAMRRHAEPAREGGVSSPLVSTEKDVTK